MTKIQALRTQPDLSKLLALPRAVDHVTHETAMGLRENAKELLAGAQVIADKMNELADAYEQHGRIAADNMARFCDDAKHFMETTTRLHGRLNGEDPPIDSEFAEELPKAPRLENGR